jgi:peptidyl-tRNA hydrolase, PTH1 family
MNESGINIGKICKAFHIDKTNVLILHDCMELEVGKVQITSSEFSYRGHNGLKSIGEHLRGPGYFQRIAIGIGRPTNNTDWVLKGFTEQEREEFIQLKTQETVSESID